MTTNGHIEAVETKEIFNEREERQEEVFGGGLSIWRWATAANETVSGWWSELRDVQLREHTRNSDHVSGTVNTIREMMIAIPVYVRAKDTSIKAHVKQANQLTDALMDKTESRGNTASIGWGCGFGGFIQDFSEQDNGAIFAADGPGRPDKELIGLFTKLIHLDSARCQRTGHREYPIIYNDVNGKRYKLHHTRVIAMASMASTIQEMYGVGFCPVSRCINIAQNLMDISRYKQEKLGSRPKRGMVTIEGAQNKQVQAVAAAIEMANEMMNNKGLSRYSDLPVIGVPGPVNLIDFASLPDGFNELESTQLGMAVIALAFGVDMRQLAFSFGVAGQTRADAEVQHAKMRGKGPGAILQEVTRQFNAKVLPPHLYLEFDYQDDEQDKQQADINKTRAEARSIYIASGTIDTRVTRQQMVATGDLSEAQYLDLELQDGRLEDGSPIESLFYLNDRDIEFLLRDIDPDSPDEEMLDTRLEEAYFVALNAPTANLKDKGRMVAILLERLKGGDEEQPEAGEEVLLLPSGEVEQVEEAEEDESALATPAQ